MSSKKDQNLSETSSITELHKEQQQEIVNKMLEQTRDNIRRTVNEARKEIPQYAQRITDLQEQTFEATGEIADSYIESQKDIINSFQSAWNPYLENYSRALNTVFSSTRISEVYTNAVRGYADNLVTVTRLTNNMI